MCRERLRDAAQHGLRRAGIGRWPAWGGELVIQPGDHNDAYLEVALPPNRTVLVRDSKVGSAGPILRFRAAEWRAILTAVRAREFDVDR